MTWEEYEINGSWKEACLNMKLSGWVRRKCWEEGMVLVLGEELWRSYGEYADNEYAKKWDSTEEFNKYVCEFRKKYPAEHYKMNNFCENLQEYKVTKEDKEATDWEAW